MIRLYLLILFLFWHSLYHQAKAQEYTYTHYTKKDGLSGETVYGVTQDKDGFLWFGTETGLSRFDGRKFSNFTTKEGLPSNEVFGSVEDTKGRLWIISFSNQICYYKDGLIHNVLNDKLVAAISFSNMIGGVIIDEDKNTIIWDRKYNAVLIDTLNHVTNYGSNRFQMDYRRMCISHFSAPLSLLKIPAMLEQETLKLLSLSSSSRQYARIQPASYDKLIFTLQAYPYKTFIWDLRKKKAITIKDNDLYYKDILEEDEGLGIYYKKGGACIYNHTLNKEQARFLPEHIIKNAYRDRENNLWFSTLGNGLFKYCNTSMFNFHPDHGSFPIQFIAGDNVNLFIGAFDQYWRITDNGQRPLSKYGIPVYKKEKLHATFKWFLKYIQGHPVNVANPSILYEPEAGIGYIKAAYAFSDTIFAATSTGAYLLWLKGNHITFDSVYEGRATTCFKQGNYYYVGTLKGLLIIDKNYRIVSKVIPYHISNIFPEGDSILWVSTFDKGIFKVKNGMVVARINQQNSNIPSDFCRCLVLDGNYLWMGTDQGLSKVNITGNKVKIDMVYTTENGLSSNQVNAIFIRDSMVYIGTPKGLDIFNKNIEYPTPLFNLLFTNISISGIPVPLDTAIILPHSGNEIKFEFAAISFSFESIIYQYRIRELNERWQEIEDPYLNLISLPSGKYTLEVRAVSDLGYSSVTIQKVFEVKKAIFEQLWFWLVCLIFFIAVMAVIIRLRINHIKRRQEEKNVVDKKMIELEQMALRAQINPHFIFNCLNSVQHFILKQDIKGANNYLSEFATLIRKTLDNSPKLYISLAEEISYLDSYIALERLQLRSPFEYKIEIGKDIHTTKLAFPNMILQPFVENAVKHVLRKSHGNGKLLIRISRINQDCLLCIIEDNGPGIDKSRQGNHSHQPKGILLTQKRIETLNLIEKQAIPIRLIIEDLSELGQKGTRITIYLPVKYL